MRKLHDNVMLTGEGKLFDYLRYSGCFQQSKDEVAALEPAVGDDDGIKCVTAATAFANAQLPSVIVMKETPSLHNGT
ncbi:UNVERIFIED_CONTAM: hypothetical protein HDU68_002032 [Siphonaria sp. JEL0065]|nr:hypothetical protein HDU68_002032 [Siphonaria sp. JEL0065]